MKKEDDLWYLLHRVRDVVGHHKSDMNRVVTEEKWQVVHRFASTPQLTTLVRLFLNIVDLKHKHMN